MIGRAPKARFKIAWESVGFTAKRLRNSARGFNPGNPSNQASRLKGRKVMFLIISEYGLVRPTTRSSVMDLRQEKRTIPFDVIASYALMRAIA
jgi:hypothetical protein